MKKMQDNGKQEKLNGKLKMYKFIINKYQDARVKLMYEVFA